MSVGYTGPRNAATTSCLSSVLEPVYPCSKTVHRCIKSVHFEYFEWPQTADVHIDSNPAFQLYLHRSI